MGKMRNEKIVFLAQIFPNEMNKIPIKKNKETFKKMMFFLMIT